jgi:hypothetical protein
VSAETTKCGCVNGSIEFKDLCRVHLLELCQVYSDNIRAEQAEKQCMFALIEEQKSTILRLGEANDENDNVRHASDKALTERMDTMEQDLDDVWSDLKGHDRALVITRDRLRAVERDSPRGDAIQEGSLAAELKHTLRECQMGTDKPDVILTEGPIAHILQEDGITYRGEPIVFDEPEPEF